MPITRSDILLITTFITTVPIPITITIPHPFAYPMICINFHNHINNHLLNHTLYNDQWLKPLPKPFRKPWPLKSPPEGYELIFVSLQDWGDPVHSRQQSCT